MNPTFSAAILAVTACLFACSDAPGAGAGTPTDVGQGGGDEPAFDGASSAPGEPGQDTVAPEGADANDAAVVGDDSATQGPPDAQGPALDIDASEVLGFLHSFIGPCA